MLSGSGMWHTFATGELPRVRMSGGANGLRMVDGSSPDASAVPATCYPSPGMLANSWDAAMCYGVGAAIGREATAMGVNLLLAPGLSIKRNPLGGRNFEYFSEDPLLSGELGKAYISGVQSTGVGACVKHFAAYNQESARMYCDSIVDERALFEIYLKPFEMALAAKPSAIMCAYNKLNGIYCAENAYLLKTVLRDRFKYDGAVISDWGAVRDRAAALKAGLDLAMPCNDELFYESLSAAYARGDITDIDINLSLTRILRLIDDVYLEPYGDFDAELHEHISYNAAAASVVLLRNENGFLPLTKNMRVAFCGELADSAPIQGYGSSHVSALKTISPISAAHERAIDVSYYRGYSDDDKCDNYIREAVAETALCDAVIVFVGQPAPCEGVDRKTLALPPEQDKLIAALTSAGRKVVAVLCSAGPVLMPWVNRVHAIVYAGLNGGAGALAAVDALYGRINPCGKLAETFPLEQEDFGGDFGSQLALYRESIFVGYRYYDKLEKPVLFPFGHGMSFSDISYDDIRVRRVGDCDFDVTITLTNSSARDAYEIVQLYVSDMTGRIISPKKQLAGYAKVFVEGQSATSTTIRITRRAFEFFNAQSSAFEVCDGAYTIIAAASAGDERKSLQIKVNGSFFGFQPQGAYQSPVRVTITDADFSTLLGSPIPTPVARPVRGEFTLDSCLADMQDTFIGRLARNAVLRRAKYVGEVGSPEYNAFAETAMHTPLLAASAMSDGDLPLNRARGIVEIANGNVLKGIRLLLKKQ